MIDDYDESSGWMFLLVPAHPGFPGQIPQSRKTVVCVCVLKVKDFSRSQAVRYTGKVVILENVLDVVTTGY